MKFIADLGSNHNGDKDRYLRLIDAAADAGCYAVKPQYFRVKELFETKNQMTEAWELPKSFIELGRNEASKKGLKFGCSIFHEKDFNFLNQYVQFWKISSFDIQRTELIQKCVDSGKPVHISCGLMEKGDLDVVSALDPRPIFFHCRSVYPVPHNETNLPVLNYPFIRGYSDHSAEPGVLYRAAAADIHYIEFHLGLDGKGFEEAHTSHCYSPETIKEVIRNVKIGKEAMTVARIDKDTLKLRTDPKTGKRP